MNKRKKLVITNSRKKWMQKYRCEGDRLTVDSCNNFFFDTPSIFYNYGEPS